jgi:hypothetical protein
MYEKWKLNIICISAAPYLEWYFNFYLTADRNKLLENRVVYFENRKEMGILELEGWVVGRKLIKFLTVKCKQASALAILNLQVLQPRSWKIASVLSVLTAKKQQHHRNKHKAKLHCLFYFTDGQYILVITSRSFRSLSRISLLSLSYYNMQQHKI